MSNVPIVASAADLPAAIRNAERNVGARAYVARKAAALGHADVIPASWGLTASGPRKTPRKPVVAAGWDPGLHPRGRNGKWIEKFGLLDLFSGANFDKPSARGRAVGVRRDGDHDIVTVELIDPGTGSYSNRKKGDQIDVNTDLLDAAPPAKAKIDGPADSRTKHAPGDTVRIKDTGVEAEVTKVNDDGSIEANAENGPVSLNPGEFDMSRRKAREGDKAPGDPEGEIPLRDDSIQVEPTGSAKYAPGDIIKPKSGNESWEVEGYDPEQGIISAHRVSDSSSVAEFDDDAVDMQRRKAREGEKTEGPSKLPSISDKVITSPKVNTPGANQDKLDEASAAQLDTELRDSLAELGIDPDNPAAALEDDFEAPELPEAEADDQPEFDSALATALDGATPSDVVEDDDLFNRIVDDVENAGFDRERAETAVREWAADPANSEHIPEDPNYDADGALSDDAEGSLEDDEDYQNDIGIESLGDDEEDLDANIWDQFAQAAVAEGLPDPSEQPDPVQESLYDLIDADDAEGSVTSMLDVYKSTTSPDVPGADATEPGATGDPKAAFTEKATARIAGLDDKDLVEEYQMYSEDIASMPTSAPSYARAEERVFIMRDEMAKRGIDQKAARKGELVKVADATDAPVPSLPDVIAAKFISADDFDRLAESTGDADTLRNVLTNLGVEVGQKDEPNLDPTEPAFDPDMEGAPEGGPEMVDDFGPEADYQVSDIRDMLSAFENGEDNPADYQDELPGWVSTARAAGEDDLANKLEAIGQDVPDDVAGLPPEEDTTLDEVLPEATSKKGDPIDLGGTDYTNEELESEFPTVKDLQLELDDAESAGDQEWADILRNEIERRTDPEQGGTPLQPIVPEAFPAPEVDPVDAVDAEVDAEWAGTVVKNPDAVKNLRLVARSANKAGSPLTEEEANQYLDQALAADTPEGAQKQLAALMTKLKLGGKQRKRYRELLDSAMGNDSGDSAGVSAQATADNLSPDNPLKAKLAEKAAAAVDSIAKSFDGATYDPDAAMTDDVIAKENALDEAAAAEVPSVVKTYADVKAGDQIRLGANWVDVKDVRTDPKSGRLVFTLVDSDGDEFTRDVGGITSVNVREGASALPDAPAGDKFTTEPITMRPDGTYDIAGIGFRRDSEGNWVDEDGNPGVRKDIAQRLEDFDRTAPAESGQSFTEKATARIAGLDDKDLVEEYQMYSEDIASMPTSAPSYARAEERVFIMRDEMAKRGIDQKAARKGRIVKAGSETPAAPAVEPVGDLVAESADFPPAQPGAKVYEHPLGARIYVNPDGSMEAYGKGGKPKKTSATPEKLAAGHGQWTEVGTGNSGGSSLTNFPVAKNDPSVPQAATPVPTAPAPKPAISDKAANDAASRLASDLAEMSYEDPTGPWNAYSSIGGAFALVDMRRESVEADLAAGDKFVVVKVPSGSEMSLTAEGARQMLAALDKYGSPQAAAGAVGKA